MADRITIDQTEAARQTAQEAFAANAAQAQIDAYNADAAAWAQMDSDMRERWTRQNADGVASRPSLWLKLEQAKEVADASKPWEEALAVARGVDAQVQQARRELNAVSGMISDYSKRRARIVEAYNSGVGRRDSVQSWDAGVDGRALARLIERRDAANAMLASLGR